MVFLLLDVVIVAIVVLFTIRGLKSGFVKTTVELVGWVAVVLSTSFLANAVSEWVFDQFISNSIKNSVEQSLIQSGQKGVAQFFDGLPNFVTNILSAYNVTASSVDLSGGAQEISASVSNQLKQPIISFVGLIFTVIIFVLGIILVRVLARVCHTVVCRIPIVSGLNRTLGLVSGFAKGVAISVLVVWLLSGLVLMMGNFLGINYTMLSKTYMFNFINQINPFIKIS